MKLGLIIISAIFINNFVLSQFLGICPFLGVSKKIDTAVGMSIAVTFVMGLASVICWAVQIFVLDPMGIGYMQTIAFILVIAGLVQFGCQKDKPNTVSGTWHISAAYYYQLRSFGCCDTEY